MCPLCIATAAITVAGTGSAAGAATLIAWKRRSLWHWLRKMATKTTRQLTND